MCAASCSKELALVIGRCDSTKMGSEDMHRTGMLKGSSFPPCRRHEEGPKGITPIQCEFILNASRPARPAMRCSFLGGRQLL